MTTWLPEDIEPDDTGELAHSEALHERYNDQNGAHLWVREGASESYVQGALAEVHDNGGGILELMGLSYGFSDPAGLLIELPGIDVIAQSGTTLHYTGSGECVRVDPDPFTVTQMGELRGFTIDGSGAAAGAVGIHQRNTGTTMAVPNVIVQNFNGVGSVGHRIRNQGTPAWNERQSGGRHHLSHNTVGLQLIGEGVQNSHFYPCWADLRVNTGEGQIGVQTKGTALVQGGYWRVIFNSDGDDAVFFDLLDSSAWGGEVQASGEQTNGAGTVGLRIAAGAVWAASGTRAFNGAMAPDQLDGFYYPPHEVTQDGRTLRMFPDPPDLAYGPAAGVSPPAHSLSGNPISNDAVGIIFGGTGSSPVVGDYIHVTYVHPYPSIPVPRITPFGAQAGYVRHTVSAISQEGFTIAVLDALPPGLGQYEVAFLYQVG